MIIIFICTWSKGEKNFTHQSISGWITSSHSRSSDLVTNFFTHINDEVFYTYVYVLYYLYKYFLVLLCLHCSHINKCISFKVSTFVHDLKLLLSIGSCDETGSGKTSQIPQYFNNPDTKNVEISYLLQILWHVVCYIKQNKNKDYFPKNGFLLNKHNCSTCLQAVDVLFGIVYVVFNWK